MAGVTAQKLADAIGLDVRRIQQLAKAGVVVKKSHGEYDLGASILGLAKYYKALSERKDAANGDPLHLARTRLTESKAEIAEIEAALARGEVIHGEIMEALWNDMVSKMRVKILGIPSRCAPQIEGVGDVKAIHQLLKEACHEALAEVANYDPEPLVAAWNAKRGREVRPDDEGGESAPGTDG